MRFFLRYEGLGPPPHHHQQQQQQQQQQQRLEAFEASVREAYPSAEDPVGDICRAIRLWSVLGCVIRKLSLSVDVSELLQEIQMADLLLSSQIDLTGIRDHPAFPQL